MEQFIISGSDDEENIVWLKLTIEILCLTCVDGDKPTTKYI